MITFVKSHIGQHNNWATAEASLIAKLESEKPITFVSFCENYIYNFNKPITSDWIGIIHDPHDTHKFYKDKNFIKNAHFVASLPHCKGLYCMSNQLKECVEKELKPSFFVDILYHPISPKSLVEWNYDKFNKSRKIYQIGNWLRAQHCIFQLSASGYNKHILPFTRETYKNLQYFLKRDNITLSLDERKSVTKVLRIDDSKYDLIFEDCIVFLYLYSSTCNNVIMECIKANTPLLINRLPAIEAYLGVDYPFFYNTLEEASEMLKDDKLIKKTNEYLCNLDKSKFDINNMINSINSRFNEL